MFVTRATVRKVVSAVGPHVAARLLRSSLGPLLSGRAERTQMYSIGPSPNSAHADIIWIHGLGGDPWSTWSCEGDYWPSKFGELIAESSGGQGRTRLRLLTYSYPSSPIDAQAGSRYTIGQQGVFFADSMRNSGVGDRPFVLIAHSLGGLVAKSAMLLASKRATEDDRMARLVSNFRGVVFLGVPHRGSLFATVITKILDALRINATSSIVANLEREFGDTDLVKLDDDFAHYIASKVGVHCRVETDTIPVLNQMLVDSLSARGNYHDESLPFEGNHFQIAKFSASANQARVLAAEVAPWVVDASAVAPGSAAQSMPQIEPPSDVSVGQVVSAITAAARSPSWVLALSSAVAIILAFAAGMLAWSTISSPEEKPQDEGPASTSDCLTRDECDQNISSEMDEACATGVACEFDGDSERCFDVEILGFDIEPDTPPFRLVLSDGENQYDIPQRAIPRIITENTTGTLLENLCTSIDSSLSLKVEVFSVGGQGTAPQAMLQVYSSMPRSHGCYDRGHFGYVHEGTFEYLPGAVMRYVVRSRDGLSSLTQCVGECTHTGEPYFHAPGFVH